MKNLVLIISFIGLLVSSAYSQIGKLDFNQKKISGEGFTVYFEVVGINDEAHALSILDDLIKDNNIEKGRYFISSTGKDRYQLYINDKVNPEYVREIIQLHDVDFDFTTISIDGVTQENDINIDIKKGSEKININAPGFPEYQITGVKEVDDNNYKNSKEQWIDENPEEYEKMINELNKKTILENNN
ncbi:MAG: hypothetical protein PHW83_06800 [Bacteroidales bacterium]|nr:hypothetical protein [Bacteroidales bacterium]